MNKLEETKANKIIEEIVEEFENKKLKYKSKQMHFRFLIKSIPLGTELETIKKYFNQLNKVDKKIEQIDQRILILKELKNKI